MTRKDSLHSLRKVLVRRRDALRNALSGDWSMLQELRTESKGDVVDFAVDAVQDEISSQLAEVESRELAYIENALERMQAGGYGLCEHCNLTIPLARLQALPYATLCIRCQREAEKSGGSRSNPDWGRLIDTSTVDNEVVFSDIEMDVS